MSYWLVGALLAIGFLIGRAWDRPRGRFADVDFLSRKARAERNARELSGRDV